MAFEGAPPAQSNPFAAPAAPIEVAPPGSKYRSLLGLSTALLWVMGTIALVQPVRILLLLTTPVESEQIGTVDILEFFVALTAVVLYCVIMPRATHNVRSFGITELEFSPLWSALIFFVPIVNLWRPYFVTKDLWKASERPPDPRVGWQYNTVPSLLPWWWWTYLLSTPFTSIGDRLASQSGEGGEPSSTALVIQILGALLTGGSALLAAQVIRGLARLQHQRHQPPTSALGPG